MAVDNKTRMRGDRKKPYVGVKDRLLRREQEEEIPLPKKPKKRAKKKTRLRKMFKKGQPHGSRSY